ncbi:MAG: bifunctional phosphopantothenoylcysteine decarboxylase/phosphopantothenate--cysteine ligase CoaBC [Bacillota bacterium]|nr:bifunctional phosphopantothenoylcysteine decarboxylase/phosphopantothenate--cysteine ligase CoaBC [Bacillota bacterium]
MSAAGDLFPGPRGPAGPAGRTVIVGVTGGIAAYKVCEVVSRLVKLGARVYVVMTRAATKFVAPLTFQTLSGNPVFIEMLEPPQLFNVEHVALAEKADLCVIAPATANIVAKIANGICDDLLTTVICATRAPVLICPAMNHNMYTNPIYQANEKRLRQLGYRFLEPGYGRLASGVVGRGRLPEPPEIVSAIASVFAGQGDYAGIEVLVTAGPTREFIDPVRCLSNPSSGKMGFAVAEAAAARGATVHLITGPSHLPDQAGVAVTRVVTAAEMHDAAIAAFSGDGVVIATAAVSDYRPPVALQHKIKKGAAHLTLELELTPDVLGSLGARKERAVLVGFAAETEDLIANARHKLVRKNLDLIVANDITEPGAGFETDTNIAHLVWPDGRIEQRPLETKRELAEHILTAVLPLVQRGAEGRDESPVTRGDPD